MEISIKTAGDVTVAHFKGVLDHRTSPEAQAQLTGLIEAGATRIVINFEGLEYISSAGLRILLAATKQVKSAGGEVRICNLNDIVREVFDISGFVSIISVFVSESAALDGF